MNRNATKPKTRTTLGPIAIGMVITAAAIIGALVYESTSTSSAPSFSETFLADGSGTTADADDAITEADGVLPKGATVFEDGYAGVANLDPDLLQVLRDAAAGAADEGIEFYVNSGWRSAAYQNQLLDEAISTYGSEDEAARWVATADTSSHVSGDAADLGQSDATAWLSQHGAEYGLCQIYRNERWHYELRPDAVDSGCPAMYADPTDDPRMQP